MGDRRHGQLAHERGGRLDAELQVGHGQAGLRLDHAHVSPVGAPSIGAGHLVAPLGVRAQARHHAGPAVDLV